MERILSPQAEMPVPPEIYKIKPARFSVKINLERTDGERIQFTCHRFGLKQSSLGRFGRIDFALVESSCVACHLRLFLDLMHEER